MNCSHSQMRTVKVVYHDVESPAEDRWSPAKLVLVQVKRQCMSWDLFPVKLQRTPEKLEKSIVGAVLKDLKLVPWLRPNKVKG